MSLSLCMVVKNEADTLNQVIKSYPYDQLVIGIDSKSSDNTHNIVKKYTNEHFTFKWENDFAKVRNLTLQKADCDWIAWVDGHEKLKRSSYKYLQMLDNVPDIVDAINVKLNILSCSGVITNYFYSAKILRNHIGMKFENPIHAVPFGIRENHIPANATEIQIDHKRSQKLSDERGKQRQKINYKQFENQLKKNPNDSRALFYLGQSYLDMNKIKKAEKTFKKYLEVSDYKEEKYQVRYYLGVMYINGNRFNDAYNVLIDSVKDDWSRNENLILLGDLCFNEGRYNEALHWYNIASNYKAPISPMFVIPECYTYVPYQKIVSSYAMMGDFNIAKKYTKKVGKWLPKHAKVILKQIENKQNE